MPDVGGVVHTHTTYATAWAARGEPIPCVLTAMADEFGGADPGRAVRPRSATTRSGRASSTTLSRHRSPAVLMRNHGVVHDRQRRRKAAVKAAVMCEDVARTVHLARQLGEPRADRARRTSTRCTTDTRTSTDRRCRSRTASDDGEPTRPAAACRSGSSPGARALYGEETLRPGRRPVAADRRGAGRRRTSRCRSSGSRC